MSASVLSETKSKQEAKKQEQKSLRKGKKEGGSLMLQQVTQYCTVIWWKQPYQDLHNRAVKQSFDFKHTFSWHQENRSVHQRLGVHLSALYCIGIP